MTYILTEEGYDVVSATDAEPLDDVHLHKPILILMDNRLTNGLGKDYCREFKSNPATSRFPIILVSANSGLEQMARESKADGYLNKPFDISELLEIVKRFE
jgi:two-component system phosphate regulon response regulator PhoB